MWVDLRVCGSLRRSWPSGLAAWPAPLASLPTTSTRLFSMETEEEDETKGGVEYVATPWGIGVNVFGGLSKMGANRAIYKWISRSCYEVIVFKLIY